LSPVISELEPVRRTKVYEEVADRIRRLIAEGRLKAGDRLPPERELAERFGVSRTSVRDAIRALEMIGLLEPRQGDGTVVLDLSPGLPEDWSLSMSLRWNLQKDDDEIVTAHACSSPGPSA